MDKKTRKIVGIWLIIGLIMVFIQVILGGITRLTDSGLSITEWNVIKGVLPPLNESDWNIAFGKYKDLASQQYKNLHSFMNLQDFKKIYFIEWFHRLWARTMGFVFLFPFIYFSIKKMIPKWLLKKLGIVIFLAALVASLGWIMVASGFENENRTWVSAYNLALHLGVAALLFSFLFTATLKVLQEKTLDFNLQKFKLFSKWIIVLVFLQILLGGLMGGMRAGALHAHWPFFMGNNTLFTIISSHANFSLVSIINYENNHFTKAIVQLLHRSFAWIIVVLNLIFAYKISKEKVSTKLKIGIYLSLIIIFFQFSLGVFTILNITNLKYAISLGILHQAFAFISLICWLFVHFQFANNKLS